MSLNVHPEFPLSEEIIYLNHAAVAPWPKRTADAVKTFAEENSLLGAHNYANWLRTEVHLREQFRQLINAPTTDDIALIKNTSEALSFVAGGLDWNPGDNIVSSNEEFPSNRIPWESLASQGVEFRQASLTAADSPEDALFQLVDHNTRMITVSSIQFASGIRLDLNRIGEYCHRREILFCVDAIQSIGAVQFDALACRADFVMADGHKWMLGPEGLGVFYTTPKAREQLKVTQFGWHMTEDSQIYDNKPWVAATNSRRFECGSSNMLGIHALSASLSLLLETGMNVVEKGVLDNAARLTELIALRSELSLLSLLDADLKSGIVVFQHTRVDNAILFRHLRDHDVVCAQRGGGIRFSPHFYTMDDQIDRSIEIVLQCPG